MREIENKSPYRYVSTHSELTNAVNYKSMSKLGYKMLNSISNTVNNKTRVEFTNGRVLNFSNFKFALEHLNVRFNLKLSKVNRITVVSGQENKVIDTSPRSIVIDKLETLINKFLSSESNVKLNNIMLSDYLESSEWKDKNFNKNDHKEIISHLEDSISVLGKRYIRFIDKLLNEK